MVFCGNAGGSAGNFAVRIRYAGRISTDLYDIRHFIMVSRPDSRSEQAFGRIGEKGLSAADTDRLVCGEHSDDRSILSAAGTGREQHPFVHGGAKRAAGCRKGKRKNML